MTLQHLPRTHARTHAHTHTHTKHLLRRPHSTTTIPGLETPYTFQFKNTRLFGGGAQNSSAPPLYLYFCIFLEAAHSVWRRWPVYQLSPCRFFGICGFFPPALLK